jgi:hypothetical protein
MLGVPRHCDPHTMGAITRPGRARRGCGTTWRAHSEKLCTAGLSVRFLSMIALTGRC